MMACDKLGVPISAYAGLPAIRGGAAQPDKRRDEAKGGGGQVGQGLPHERRIKESF